MIKALICYLRGHKKFMFGEMGHNVIAYSYANNLIFTVNICARCKKLYVKVEAEP